MHKAGFAVLRDPSGKLMELRRKPTRKEIIANDRVPCLKVCWNALGPRGMRPSMHPPASPGNRCSCSWQPSQQTKVELACDW